MKQISILNDVLGPVMRGPSSAHTAGSYHLGALARSLLGDTPAEAEISFDPHGSYARVYREQGSDLAFSAGLLGWPITDERFPRSIEMALAHRMAIRFLVEPLPGADHPNTARIRVMGRGGGRVTFFGRSVGGGAVEITRLEGWPILLTGAEHEVLVEARPNAEAALRRSLEAETSCGSEIARQQSDGLVLLHIRCAAPLSVETRARLRAMPGVLRIWQADPLMFAKQGKPMFLSATDMVAYAEANHLSAGRAARAYEAQLLGLPESRVMEEMLRRFDIMAAAVRQGLEAENARHPRSAAGHIFQAEAGGQAAFGGMHTRAAARAMAAMHVNCGMGVICAAPTAGSAGVLPGVLTTLHEERQVDREQIALAMLAAGAVGMVVARRATFAAEVAGCQAEIGTATAMAAAAVVEAAGGSARQAADAAAVSFQNTVGSICGKVQGISRLPCHTRNAVGASSALVVADLVMGGFETPMPLDETIDAVYAVGRMLPAELRVTSPGRREAATAARTGRAKR